MYNARTKYARLVAHIHVWRLYNLLIREFTIEVKNLQARIIESINTWMMWLEGAISLPTRLHKIMESIIQFKHMRNGF